MACSKANKNLVKASSKNSIIIELHSGNNGGFKEETTQVITTQDAFAKVWKQAFANYMRKEEMPEVDFNKNTIILVALGEKTSGGYTIKTTNTTVTNNSTIVNVISTSPGKGCMTTEAITYPYQIVQIDKFDNPIKFNITEKVIDCESK